MKVLLFCNDIQSAQIIFELIRLRQFAGVVVPYKNIDLITKINESGYIQNDQIFTPDPNNNEELITIIEKIKPDLGLVATFPRIFPKQIYKIPTNGFYNMHYGILPQYRSANPVFWQIRNGEKIGGVTVFKINQIIDGGDIIMEEQFPIDPYDNYSIVLNKSADTACRMIEPLLKKLTSENLKLKYQNLSDSKYYPKPTFKDVQIDWNHMPIEEIISTVNAGNPWNRGAITTLDSNEIRLIQVSPAIYEKELPDEPGRIILANIQHGVFVLCKNKKLLRIDSIYSNLGYHSGGMILFTGLKEGKILK